MTQAEMRELRFFTPDEYRQIARGFSARPRAAARHGLTDGQVAAIRASRRSYEQVCADIYPPGTLLRLNAEMDDSPGRTPAAGTVGQLRDITRWGKDTVQLWVDWPDPVALAVMWPRDDFTLLAPAS